MTSSHRLILLRIPWIALGVAVASVWIFVLEKHAAGTTSPSAPQAYGFGALLGHDTHQAAWRWIMANFLHFSVAHIANNMVVLLLVALGLELWLGPVVLFLTVAATVAVASYGGIIASGAHTVSAGASGIVFAYIGAAVGADPRGRLGFGTYAWQLLFLNLIITFSTTGISAGAHIGGLAVGVLVGSAWGLVLRRQRAGRADASSAWSSYPETPANRASRRVLPVDRSRQRRNAVYLLVIDIAFLAWALHSLDVGSAVTAVIVVAVFLIPALVGFAALLPGASGFALEPDGISITRLWRTTRLGWHAIARTEAHDPERGPIVVRAITRDRRIVRLYTVEGMSVPDLDTTLRRAHEEWIVHRRERGLPIDEAPANAQGFITPAPTGASVPRLLRVGEHLVRRTVIGITLGAVTAGVPVWLAYTHGTLH